MAHLKQFYLDIGHKAFAEDRAMLEAQQQVIDRSPGDRFAPLGMDKASAAFRGVMNRLMREESGSGDSAPTR